jgi:hypothetical protein
VVRTVKQTEPGTAPRKRDRPASPVLPTASEIIVNYLRVLTLRRTLAQSLRLMLVLFAACGSAHAQAVSAFGLSHSPIGGASAQIQGGTGFLRVSGSGVYGVSIDMQQGKGHCYKISDPDVGGSLPVGAAITTSYIGSVMGNPNQLVVQATTQKTASGPQITISFPALAPASVKVEAYFNNAMVAMYTEGSTAAMRSPFWQRVQDFFGRSPLNRCTYPANSLSVAPSGEVWVMLGDEGVCASGDSVQVGGHPPIFAHVLRFVPNTAGGPPIDWISRVEVAATGMPSFTIEGEAVAFDRLTHMSVGGAVFSMPQGQLGVANPLGNPAVATRASLGVAESVRFLWTDLNPNTSLPDGSYVDVAGTGVMSGLPLSSLGSTRATKSAGVFNLTADFTAVGSTTHIVEIYAAGTQVVSVSGHTGPAALALRWPWGCGKRILWFPWNLPCFAWHWNLLTAITIPGHGTFMGDEVRILAEGATNPVSALDSFTVSTSAIPLLTLTTEDWTEGALTIPTSICFGDGTATACPCGNAGASGNGCGNSLNASGANLAASGNAGIASDSFVLSGTGMPSSSALYFQGTTRLNGGAGVVFGDGLRCVGGTVIRLGTKVNAAGSSQYPAPGDASVSVRGLCAAGDVRLYQVWYRNAAAFCTPSTFNLTNAVEITWVP